MKYLTFLLFAVLLAACGYPTEEGWILKTADPNLSIGFRWAVPPPSIPTVEPAVAPCRTVAGNIDSQGRKLYHTEDSPQWSQIVIDESKGEKWFCDTASAEAEGWVKAGGQ